MSNDLTKRLRGKYSVGPDGVIEDRDFGNFTPRICIEAANHIEALTAAGGELAEALRNLQIATTNTSHARMGIAGGLDVAIALEEQADIAAERAIATWQACIGGQS